MRISTLPKKLTDSEQREKLIRDLAFTQKETTVGGRIRKSFSIRDFEDIVQGFENYFDDTDDKNINCIEIDFDSNINEGEEEYRKCLDLFVRAKNKRHEELFFIFLHMKNKYQISSLRDFLSYCLKDVYE